MQVYANDTMTSVASAAELDAVFATAGGWGVQMLGPGDRRLALIFDGPQSNLVWEGDLDIRLSWGPVPPGMPPEQTVADDAEDFPEWMSMANDYEPYISEELARRAGHEFLATGERPTCVLWLMKP